MTIRADGGLARHTATAVVLHWAIAALLIAEFAHGWWMQGIAKEPPGIRADAFNLHKSMMLAMPLSGYFGSVFSGYPIKWFGVALPAWGGSDPALKELMSAVHLTTSWILLVSMGLHVAGTIKHALAGDAVMARMGIGARAGTAPRADAVTAARLR